MVSRCCLVLLSNSAWSLASLNSMKAMSVASYLRKAEFFMNLSLYYSILIIDLIISILQLR